MPSKHYTNISITPIGLDLWGLKINESKGQVLKLALREKMAQSELPRAPITRIVKDETGLRVSEEAKNTILEATEQFIRNLAKESSSHTFFDGKKTIQNRDVVHILNDKRYKRMIPRAENYE